ncbi:hypothetical protein BJ166DRAFT_600764 [Pestalotiopsis sp. NC0098]|nr:hypothetical protein BJ166DRAFT_600764 [Pestalotiopsis sp. NC0098]
MEPMSEVKGASPAQESLSSGSLNEKNEQHTAFSKEEFLSPDFKSDHINLIVREGIILGAGAEAILLQVANPGVGAGVNEHSNFAYRVQDRLRTTMTFVYCMSFGTPQEKKTIVDMITAVHKNVVGTLSEGRDKGKTYSALDPGLQLWVAATLYATGLSVYERVFGKIKDEQLHEKIYREYSILACALQVPPEMWPRTRRDFWAYWDHEIATIEVTQHAKDVAHDLLYLRKAPWHLRMFTPALRLVTAEWLPERIRAEYGVRRHPRRYKMVESLVKATYPALPLSIRSYPVKLYMNDMRKRLANKRGVIGKDA